MFILQLVKLLRKCRATHKRPLSQEFPASLSSQFCVTLTRTFLNLTEQYWFESDQLLFDIESCFVVALTMLIMFDLLTIYVFF